MNEDILAILKSTGITLNKNRYQKKYQKQTIEEQMLSLGYVKKLEGFISPHDGKIRNLQSCYQYEYRRGNVKKRG